MLWVYGKDVCAILCILFDSDSPLYLHSHLQTHKKCDIHVHKTGFLDPICRLYNKDFERFKMAFTEDGRSVIFLSIRKKG